MANELNSSWEQAQHKSYEDLKREADAQKAKRENLQPMQIGKRNYGSVFRVGDRLRPELALSLAKPDSVEDLGSGAVDLGELVPERAFRDLEHALAAATTGVQDETAEGIREEMLYDADEVLARQWAGERSNMKLAPPVEERTSEAVESAAYEGGPPDAVPE